MAFTRKDKEDASIYGYTMDANKYFNYNQARVPFGILGGNQVSLTRSNMVNQESRLLGLDSNNVKYSCLGCHLLDSGIPCKSNCTVYNKKHLNEVYLGNYNNVYNNNNVTVNKITSPSQINKVFNLKAYNSY
jgi:hypothetical protein